MARWHGRESPWMPPSRSRASAGTRTSSKARHASLLDAVVAAARIEQRVRRARHLRKKRARVKDGAGLPGAGARLAVAARELRRLTSTSAALDERRRQP
jgi:hypothetical protein